MTHSFDVEIAKEYGVNCAVILQHLYFWIAKNKANDRNFHDGRYWTYNSIKAFSDLFPYMTDKQIRNALKSLEETGLVLTGNYNSSAYDRTKWYALSEKGESIFLYGKSHLPKTENGSDKKGEPIPDTIPDIYNTDNKTDSKGAKPQKRFSHPSVEEVKSYCQDQGYAIDPEKFVDYYTSNGWMVGKNHMKDWKATVRNWAKRDKEQEKKNTPKDYREKYGPDNDNLDYADNGEGWFGL